MRRPITLACIAVTVATVAGLAPTAQPAHATPAPVESATFESVRVGATGPRVEQVQAALAGLGYSIGVDGRFGQVTVSRVRAFQESNGLRVDGIVGPVTWRALGLDATASPAAPPATPAPLASATFESMRVGATGQRVEQVQAALAALGYSIGVDGRFGPVTVSRVRAFQESRGLQVDGIVGPVTWRALGLDGSPTPATPAPAAGSYVHPSADVERWRDDAIAAGWQDSDWPRLSCIIERESRGVTSATNPSSAMGLLQIMWSVHGSWIGGQSSQLLDGPTNLSVGRQLFTRAGGWSPWNSTANPCPG